MLRRQVLLCVAQRKTVAFRDATLSLGDQEATDGRTIIFATMNARKFLALAVLPTLRHKNRSAWQRNRLATRHALKITGAERPVTTGRSSTHASEPAIQ